MKREEFEAMQEELQKQIGPWRIMVGNSSKGEFFIGCYFDNSRDKWIVYRNEERGMNYERLQTKKEEEAFDELHSMIEYEIKLYQEYLKRHNLQ